MKINKQDGPPEDLLYFDEDLNLSQKQVEDVVVEKIGDRLDATLIVGVITETDAHGEKGEGDREAQQHQEDEQAEHQNGDLWISHRSLVSRGNSGQWPSSLFHEGIFGFPDVLDAIHPDTCLHRVPTTDELGKTLQYQ